MKGKKQFITGMLILTGLMMNSQEIQWGGRFGGIGEDVIRSMQVDGLGNTYTTGYFTDTADFDIGTGEVFLTSNGFYDVFISKHDTNGNFEWVRKIGGTGFEYAVAMNTDDLGNIFLTGVYEGTVDFNPGSEEYLLTSSGGLDIFILKLDANGEFVWARSVGGVGYEESTAIDITPAGKVIILGYFYEEVDFDPGVGTYLMNSMGGSDSFILTLDEFGNFESGERFGGNDLDLAMDMVISDAGGIYITGFFEGSADMNPHALEEFIVTAELNSLATYVLYLNPDGEFVNAVHTRGGNTLPNGIATDISGNAYVTGYFDGVTNFDPDPSAGNQYLFESLLASNAFIMKLDNAGNLSWARQVVSDEPVFAYDIAVNSLGQVLSTGYFVGSADFDPSTSEFLLSQESVNDQDAYLSILDSEGNFVDAKAFGGISFIDTADLALDAADNVYLAAHFETTVDLNPDPNVSETVNSIAFRDSYIIKLTQNTLGIEIPAYISYKVAPNPANSYIEVSATKNLVSTNYVIFDLHGRAVISGVFSDSGVIDVSSLRTGIYLIKPQNLEPLKFIKI